MTNPQPDKLRDKPQRAEPWQPDRSDGGIEPQGPVEHAATDTTITTSNQGDVAQRVRSAPSPEATIPRDAQTGQSLDDASLESNDPAGLSDGRAGSGRLPES